MYLNDTTQEIPYGYCHCGCGQKTNLANRNDAWAGLVKGQPKRYIRGHQCRLDNILIGPNPSGLCMCGCGERTALAKQTDIGRGWVAHEPVCFISGHQTYRPAIERFWDFVDKRGPDGCWLWTGRLNVKGYGVFALYRLHKSLHAHRFSWEIHFGPILDNLHCLHKCDNPACVNPEHLFLGTNLDNIKDMVEKGRNMKGSRHTQAKLTEDKVRTIRQRSAQGESNLSLANAFGVSSGNIWLIVTHKAWRHVE